MTSSLSFLEIISLKFDLRGFLREVHGILPSISNKMKRLTHSKLSEFIGLWFLLVSGQMSYVNKPASEKILHL